MAAAVAASAPVHAGSVPAYSNYGYALAGYVVERVSGQPFAEFVHTHLLAPLGMVRSTFSQPPEHLLESVARGCRAADAPPLAYFETIAPSPAGGSRPARRTWADS